MKINVDRIKYLDFLRLIGFVIVFSFHVIVDMHYHNMHDFSYFLNNIYSRPNFNIGMVGMIFFFITSGASLYLSTSQKKNFNIFEFYKKRFFKLIIPFYISYIIYFVIKILLHHTVHIFHNITVASPFSFIFTILGIDEYINACGISNFSLGIGEWYLGCILFCYLLFPLIFYFYKKKPFFVFAVMTIYFVFIQKIIIGQNIAPHQNFFNHIYNFFLGMFLVDERLINLKLINKKNLMIVSLVSIFVLYFSTKKIFIYDNIVMTISSVFMFLFAFSIEDILCKYSKISYFLKLYSKYGLELFLVHHFVIYEVNFVLGYPNVSKKAIIIYIFDLILTFIFALIVHFLSNKIKLIKVNI